MKETLFTVHNLWMMIATILVFIMHLGFATLESGLTQSKNTVNILFKNVLIIAIGLLTYTLIGFNLMYPGEAFSGMFFGFNGLGVALPTGGDTAQYGAGHYTYWTDFIFQAMFAATCITIVSGAVAERIKLEAFLLFAVFFVAIIYPMVGMWKWGGGFLETLGTDKGLFTGLLATAEKGKNVGTPFYDFAGSSIVHSVGGWAALAGVLLLGARKGKYINGKIKAIPGHNMPLAAMGVFLLWFGWFGFNGGSVLSAEAGNVSRVFVTTSLAAAAGALGAFFTSFFILKTHDLTMSLNGILGGLVGITAGADVMSVSDAVLIGLISGILVVLAVLFFDRKRLDDPVGAIAVHLVCGVWGTMAVAIFGAKAGWGQFVSQLIGVSAIGLFSFGSAYVVFYIVKKTIGIRVSETEELEGLDLHEHGMSAYPNFTMTTAASVTSHEQHQVVTNAPQTTNQTKDIALIKT
ncbi:ammonium transporter [uncultured Microscilla sp.]|uniref:ammonium transporter n=1 Tax=uncultured Microscilla sp. TaxID=432653 RepID=UPI002620E6A3|nr:ammonium transporter [uncultured Microscilla sp.]